jgi:hypothetical protein
VGPRIGLDDVEKRKFLTLPELELRQENVDLYIHSHIRLHGVVLNSLSTGTTLPFTTGAARTLSKGEQPEYLRTNLRLRHLRHFC